MAVCHSHSQPALRHSLPLQTSTQQQRLTNYSIDQTLPLSCCGQQTLQPRARLHHKAHHPPPRHSLQFNSGQSSTSFTTHLVVQSASLISLSASQPVARHLEMYTESAGQLRSLALTQLKPPSRFTQHASRPPGVHGGRAPNAFPSRHSAHSPC
eukprot:Selendium_serpulae@DN4929_c0_g1_i1.p1